MKINSTSKSALSKIGYSTMTFFRTSLLVTLLVLAEATTMAQTTSESAPIEWGQVNKEDFLFTCRDTFPDASSITLCSYGQTYVIGKLETRTVVHVRFAVLHSDGIERANVSIPFWTGKSKGTEVKKRSSGSYGGDSDGDKVQDVKGFVYNLDEQGEIVKSELISDQVFVKDYSDIIKNGMVSFALPNIKIGSIAEYSYVIVRQYAFSLKTWSFQDDYPCLHSEYRVSFPDERSYAIIKKGALKDKIEISPSVLTDKNALGAQSKVIKYMLNNAPGMPDEPFITSMDNYRTKLIIQLSEYYDPYSNSNKKVISTWDQLVSTLRYSDFFGRQLNRNSGLFKENESLYEGSISETEKIKNCYNLIRNHFRCNGSYAVFAETNLKDAYSAGVGSSAEINLALAVLLKNAGLEPKMALVSTRDHGTVNENYPFISQFNHVICLVELEGKTFFLDASDQEGDYQFPPAEIVDCRAFVIDNKNPEFINITTEAIYDRFFMCSAKFDGDSLAGKLQFKYKGYAASIQRAKMNKDGDDYLQKMVNKHELLFLSNPMFVNEKDTDKPLLLQVDFAYNMNTTTNPGLIYLNPFSLYGDFKNEFTALTRQIPVEFNYPISITYMYNITVPEGYVVDYIPENTAVSNQDNSASVMVYYQNVGGIIQIKTELHINKLSFQPSEYENLKTISELWEQKHDEMIVLKMKK